MFERKYLCKSTTSMTKHFSLTEMTRTNTGLENTPDAEARANLVYLCRTLERVRRAIGNKPITINSGFRSKAVNKAVGGVTGSLHLYGRACYISLHGLNDEDRTSLLTALDDTFPTEMIVYGNYVHFAI